MKHKLRPMIEAPRLEPGGGAPDILVMLEHADGSRGFVAAYWCNVFEDWAMCSNIDAPPLSEIADLVGWLPMPEVEA